MGRTIRMKMMESHSLDDAACDCGSGGACRCGTEKTAQTYDYYACPISDADMARRHAYRDAFTDSMTSASRRR